MTPLFHHPNDNKPSGTEVLGAVLLALVTAALMWFVSVLQNPLTP